MIRYLEETEKYRSRALWEEAFEEDSAEFRDYYYREKTRDNAILVLEKEGHIVSMLHRNPYMLAAGDKVWKCDYIVGAATEENSRRKGYLRQLMEKALRDMRKEHMPFTFLMPALEALYVPFGFAYIFAKPEWRLNAKGISSLKKVPFSKSQALTAAQWINQWLKERYEVYAMRDCAYMERLQQEIESENGSMELLYKGSQMAGLTADWGITKKEQRMLFCGEVYTQESGAANPCIMGRILDLPEFVKVIRLQKDAKEELNLILELHDSQLQENEGLWKWHLDKTSSYVEKITGEKNRLIPDLVLETGELTAWLTGYSVPEAARPYAEKIRCLNGVFLDEIV